MTEETAQGASMPLAPRAQSSPCSSLCGPQQRSLVKSHLLGLFYFNLLLIELKYMSLGAPLCHRGSGWMHERVSTPGTLTERLKASTGTFSASSLFMFDFDRNLFPLPATEKEMRFRHALCIRNCHLFPESGTLNISPPTS